MRSYYLDPKVRRRSEVYVSRRLRVADTLRDLDVRYHRRGRWRGPIARSWRRVRVR